ncbi:MAG: adenine deaminase, partial [Chloroflexi bacterium]|nr:adenine deaminase [Chloroflexota bacterium]
MDLERLIAAARGDIPCDLLLADAQVINTATAEIETTDVAILDGYVVGVGSGYQARQTVALGGRYVCPSLIDGHVHLESSHLSLQEYARAVLPHGTGAIVTDAHEIANVCGLPGIRYLIRCAEHVPLDIFFMVPSCVPATHMETAGADLGPREIEEALSLPGIIGLGEFMNYPGVIFRSPDVLAKLRATEGRLRDGHAPGLSGKDLASYIAAGIRSDHESTRLAEAQEKLRRGMYVMIREGSSEKNLAELLPLARGDGNRHFLFVVDDRTCGDILHDGDVDAVVRKA